MRDFCNLIGLLTRPYLNLQVVFRVREEKNRSIFVYFLYLSFRKAFLPLYLQLIHACFKKDPTQKYMNGRIHGLLESVQTKWGFSPSLPEIDLQWEIQRKFFLKNDLHSLNNVLKVLKHLYNTIVEKPIINHKGVEGGCGYNCKRVSYYGKSKLKLINGLWRKNYPKKEINE